jgi:nicotinate-nucleotide adenylyltransferase
VARRPGFEPDWSALEHALPDVRHKIDWIDLPPIAISASEIQRRIHAGESIAGLVPDAVARYIGERKLYLLHEGHAGN